MVALQFEEGQVLTGVHLMTTFLRRLVQPLQARPQAMCEYTSVDDASRVSRASYDATGLLSVVKILTSVKDLKSRALASPIKPFAKDNPMPKVFLHHYLDCCHFSCRLSAYSRIHSFPPW